MKRVKRFLRGEEIPLRRLVSLPVQDGNGRSYTCVGLYSDRDETVYVLVVDALVVKALVVSLSTWYPLALLATG